MSNVQANATAWQRGALLTQGFTDSAIRRATADGALRPVRRGAYLTAAEYDTVPSWGRHAVVVGATAPKLAAGAVVSHLSAAALHGLAVWPPPSDRVHVTRQGGVGGGRRTRTLHLHIGHLAPADVVRVSGLAVTSIARTVVDVARTETFETGVVIVDHALHTGVVDPQSLTDVLARQHGRAGTHQAVAVLAFADGLSESVGESRSRVAMVRDGLPRPVLQHRVLGPHGEFLGRADFAYVDQRIAGEFDGKLKYQPESVDGVRPLDVVVAERRRAEGMERAGWLVVRWMWDDIGVPSAIAGKFRRAFDLRSAQI